MEKSTNNVKEWKPVKHRFIRSVELQETIHKQGYAVVPFANSSQLEAIRNIYKASHNLKEGGMFFGIYTADLEYRKRIHQQVTKILEESFERYFNEYRDALSCFVIKAPGDNSEFFIHQDPSFIDEFKFSHLHVWCPLYDISMESGPMCIIPKSHKFFYPYRAISIPAPFDNIRPLLRRYLQPLLLKAGEAVLLDSRLIHSSLPNLSGITRPVMLSQIYPKSATLMTPYYDAHNDSTKLELYDLPDDYFLKNTNFLYGVMDRPALGKYREKVDFSFHSMTEDEFLRLAKENEMEAVDIVPPSTSENSRMIQEPIE